MSKKIKFEIEKLPQNIKLVGDQEEKKIYISFEAYKKVHDFTKNKLDNESGGLLLGECIEAFNLKNVVIYDFIEAKYTEATKTTLTFTHKTWDYLHKMIDKHYENAKIVGWIHTHPGFGIFLSDYDKFIQKNFFSDENQVAYVVDPKQKIEGFFALINGNLQKCKGFYIFDEPGKDIIIDNVSNIIEEDEKINKSEKNNLKNKLFVSLFLLVMLLILLIGIFLYFNNKINALNVEFNSKLTEIERKQQSNFNDIYYDFYKKGHIPQFEYNIENDDQTIKNNDNINNTSNGNNVNDKNNEEEQNIDELNEHIEEIPKDRR